MADCLKISMQKILLNYDKLRTGNVGETWIEEQKQFGKSTADQAFWDVVVLTACDKDQEEAFNIQLQIKLQNNVLPLCQYLVVPDEAPLAGCKIGAGGSTFLVIDRLKKIFPDRMELERKKILLIHAGGWSQRLPSASVLGKLFMPLPIGLNADYDMLDVKLALYLPFLKLMGPGIFLTASDDIELFDVDAVEVLSSAAPLSGMVALGHPSTLQIGSSHGVFVCNPPIDCEEARFLPCLRVLQKPSVEEMMKVGAVYNASTCPGNLAADPLVVTDSAYWFDMETLDKLHAFFQQNGLPLAEVDCYGDFMQPLGSNSSTDYIEQTRNPTLQSIRRLLFQTLSDLPLHILFLPGSRFIHLGTMPEYHDSVLKDASFRGCFAVTKHIMHSVLHEKCDISKESILEYCYFPSPISVGANCLISGCSNEAISSWSTKEETSLEIGKGIFLHTVPLKMEGQRYFCTIFCGLADDIKGEVAVEEISKLEIFRFVDGQIIRGFFHHFPGIFPEGISENSLWISLWKMKIFPVCRFPGQSFLESLRILNLLRNGQRVRQSADRTFMSMADVLGNKDVAGMIEFRQRLLRQLPFSTTRAARKILSAALGAVKPSSLIKQSLRIDGEFLKITDFSGILRFSHRLQGNLHLLAVGKAAIGMMEALLESLDGHIKSAVLLIPRELQLKVKSCSFWNSSTVKVLFGGMANLPNEESVENTRMILDFLQSIGDRDTLICAISGGASALLVAPTSPVTLSEKLEITRALMKEGAPIEALNTVRGALSDVKNGRLAGHVHPGVRCASLILSDIVGDPLDLIGGAPTVPCVAGKNDAISILQKFGFWENASPNVKSLLLETREPVLGAEIQNILIGNNTVALQACQQKATQLGYQSLILTTRLKGGARAAAANFAELVRDVGAFRKGKSESLNVPFTSARGATIDWKLPFCVLAGGETTVKVTGSGLGGRNQEIVLAFSVALQNVSVDSEFDSETRGVFVSCGTDGQDGPTDAAGAMTLFPCPWTDDVKARAQTALQNNDSYNFFSQNETIGSLIKMGMTGTNVMDLQILIVN